MPRVALSAGHGTDRPGGCVPGFEEFEFTHSVVGYVERMLSHLPEFEVLLLQPLFQETVLLGERTTILSQLGADLCLDFHADKNTNPAANGHWVFYWHSDPRARQLADTWNHHARYLLPHHSRGVWACKPGGWPNFHMCRVPAWLGIPAILIEHGFMTNPQDLELLQTEQFRIDCAVTAVRTICDFTGVTYRAHRPEQWIRPHRTRG